MEVYTALFDINYTEVKKTEALIVDEGSFTEEMKSKHICFFGDGAEKCREILEPKGMIFLEGIKPDANGMAVLAHEKYLQNDFENLAYFEPFYLKDFIAGKPKVKGLQ
jgi:tRNA threonylcarbamoyladenosine biosynthesis protein TsaB